MKIPKFKTVEEVESWIEEQELQPVSYFLDFPEAIIGITTDNALVYSMKKMVEPVQVIIYHGFLNRLEQNITTLEILFIYILPLTI